MHLQAILCAKVCCKEVFKLRSRELKFIAALLLLCKPVVAEGVQE